MTQKREVGAKSRLERRSANGRTGKVQRILKQNKRGFQQLLKFGPSLSIRQVVKKVDIRRIRGRRGGLWAAAPL